MERYLSEVKTIRVFWVKQIVVRWTCSTVANWWRCYIIWSFLWQETTCFISHSTAAHKWKQLTEMWMYWQAVKIIIPLIQKEYLIIIIISPKYYETVTASPAGLENDERTFNTVYIHKQVPVQIKTLVLTVRLLYSDDTFILLSVFSSRTSSSRTDRRISGSSPFCSLELKGSVSCCKASNI